MPGAPGATARLLWSEPGEAAIVGQISEDPFARLKARVPPAIPDSRSARLQPSGADRASARLNAFDAQQVDRLVRGVTLTWLAGVVLLLARMAGGWWHVRRLHRPALATSSSGWQTTCRRIAYRLGLPASAHVVESARVDVPTVVGWLRPAILLPVAAMATLTPAQVEAILAHELAHIRRHDYLVNLLQTVAETLLFYHPAVWWLSKRIRAEREHCCDEVAVSLCGDAVAYAKALAELEAWRTDSTVLAVAAPRDPPAPTGAGAGARRARAAPPSPPITPAPPGAAGAAAPAPATAATDGAHSAATGAAGTPCSAGATRAARTTRAAGRRRISLPRGQRRQPDADVVARRIDAPRRHAERQRDVHRRFVRCADALGWRAADDPRLERPRPAHVRDSIVRRQADPDLLRRGHRAALDRRSASAAR